MPIDDLVGVISLPVQIPSFGKGRGANRTRFQLSITSQKWVTPLLILCVQNIPIDILSLHFEILISSFSWFCLSCHPDESIIEPKMSASFVPDHKASMVLFLDRVYGIDNQDFLLHVLEVGFLPDMRAAASLDTVSP